MAVDPEVSKLCFITVITSLERTHQLVRGSEVVVYGLGL